MSYILAIDQGTTSSRAVLYDSNIQIVATEQKEFRQIYPASGFVEHNIEEIFDTVQTTCKKVLEKSSISSEQIAAIGITNQRETTVVWDKNSGKALHNAIVWQDRRTADFCEEMKKKGYEKIIRSKTGMLLDPYFSATKIRWILQEYPEAMARAKKGEVLFGTIDSYLVWRLTGGRSHFTDTTNASRTLLYNIFDCKWDEELLDLFEVPAAMLPEIKNCADDFGETESSFLGKSVKITGVAGDQQSAIIGQACFTTGMLKSTYGTGCFALLNIGEKPRTAPNNLITTVAYSLQGKTTYAIEGSIFIAGAAVQWLRDQLNFVQNASDCDALARQAKEDENIYLVPAFTGLGAPYWDPNARGGLFGLSRGTGIAEIVRSTLESVCYQSKDLFEIMFEVVGEMQTNFQASVRVDGGMAASNWTMQFLADILNVPVDRPQNLETTVLGAAYLAGFFVHLYPSPEEFSKQWNLERQFLPQMEEADRERKYQGWKKAVHKTFSSS